MLQTKFVEKIETRMLCSKLFSRHRTVYELMWQNVLDSYKLQMAIKMAHAHACWTTNGATDTHSEYYIF
jgi:5-keto 4-deoxyuronate isomerase